MARVLAVSSHAVHGHVGLGATVPALQWLGHEVWPLPTVLLASRPGLGRLVRHEVPTPDLRSMFSALEDDGAWPSLDAVLTGYFPSAAAVATAADAVERIRQTKPGVTVLVDPILGDGGRLYIEKKAAEAIRDRLLPLATIATPNLFELRWLTGRVVSERDEIAQAAQCLGVQAVVVTSASVTIRGVSTILATDAGSIERFAPGRACIPNGAGDLLAGLLLGHLLNNKSAEQALDAGLAALDCVLSESERKPTLQLSALRKIQP